MEFFGPALELVRTGSPYVAGFSSAVALAGIYFREVRRHHASEIATWSARYDELQERCSKLELKDEEHTKLWLAAEREKAELIRAGREVAREVGGS